jgi:hypothetical protein
LEAETRAGALFPEWRRGEIAQATMLVALRDGASPQQAKCRQGATAVRVMGNSDSLDKSKMACAIKVR